jgi:O-antigen/teichoic acid export membrane protein
VKELFKNYFSKIRNPESIYNQVSYLFLGNLVTILSQFIFAPFITRFYTPESYGIFSVIFAAGLNISTILTLRYEQSLLLEDEKSNRNLIAKIIVTAGITFSAFLAVVILIKPEPFVNLFGITGTPYWALVLPTFIFFNIFFMVTGVEITLEKKYRDSFVWGSPSMIISKIFNLGYGFYFKGHFSGLMLGDILVRLFFLLFRLIISLKKRVYDYILASREQFKKALLLLRKYKRFPLYDLPSYYVSLFVNQSHIYLLTALKEKAILGWISISFSLFDAPLRLISYSVSPVLMQRATVMRDQMQEFRKLIGRVVSLIYLITLIPSVILFFWGQEIFAFVFGQKWAMAGLLVSSFIFFYMFRFEYDILDNIMTVLGLQKRKLIVYLVEGLTRVSLLLITYLITKDALKTIIIWAYECGIVYFFVTIYAYRLLHLNLNRIIFLKICVSILFLTALFFRGLSSK